MKIIKTKIKDLLNIQNNLLKDKRGYFKELLRENLIKQKFPFKVIYFSKKNVIRGLNLQTKDSQGKYVSVIKGSIFDVVVDLRKNSKSFGKKFTIILSENNNKSLYIPPVLRMVFVPWKMKIMLFIVVLNIDTKKVK